MSFVTLVHSLFIELLFNYTNTKGIHSSSFFSIIKLTAFSISDFDWVFYISSFWKKNIMATVLGYDFHSVQCQCYKDHLYHQPTKVNIRLIIFGILKNVPFTYNNSLSRKAPQIKCV